MMKKIFTLLMLGIFSVTTISAEENVLWEGDYNISWELPDGDEHKEWKGLGQDDFAAMEAGQKLNFYFAICEAEYHAYKFDDWSWEALPGCAQVDINEDTKVVFEVTQEMKDAIAANGFAIHGHGIHLTKVTKEVEGGTPSNILWEGDYNISWELPDGDAHKEWKELGQADFAAMEAGQKLNFYFAICEAEYHAYKFDDWSWEALPGCAQVDITEDTKVVFEVTQAVKDAIAAGGFAIHGHGIHLTKVEKEVAEEGQTTVSSILRGMDNAGKQEFYNLSGQRVQQPAKGLYIVNGRKYIVR